MSTVSYSLVIVAGLALTGAIGYFLFKELFSRETPSGIYNESSKICLDNFQVLFIFFCFYCFYNIHLKLEDALGKPIKISAESGGRRVFNVKHKYVLEKDKICMIMNYYLTGSRNKATIIVKTKKVCLFL